MKKPVKVLFCLFLLLSCAKEKQDASNPAEVLLLTQSDYSTIHPTIDKEQALKLVESIAAEYEGQWIEISKDPIPASTTLLYNGVGGIVDNDDYSTFVSPSYDAWLLVVDPDYHYGGTQKQLHLFVNTNSGEITKEWLMGRAIVIWDDSRYTYLYDDSIPNIYDSSPSLSSKTSSSSNKWAIILSGGYDMYNNYARYWNDCQSFYLTLTNDLGYNKSHIFSLVSDGLDTAIDRRTGVSTYDSSPWDFDGDGVADINYSASKANLSDVFNTLASLVSSGDEVLIFMTDHGDTGAKFYMWGGEVLTGTELNTEINKLGYDVSIDVVMGQCHSGSFTSYLLANNRSISTSCSPSEPAYTSGINGYNYFLHAWTESLTVSSTDIDFDGNISIYEMFKYANNSVSSFQTPNLSSKPEVLQIGHDLLGNKYYPKLSGPDYASTDHSITIDLIDLMPAATFNSWSTGNGLAMSAPTNTSVKITGTNTNNQNYYYPGADVVAAITYDGQSFNVKKTIISVWRPGTYSNCGLIYKVSSNIYVVGQFIGAYGYYWWTNQPSSWMVMSGQGTTMVYIQEGASGGSVKINCSFYTPLGESVLLEDMFY